MQEITLFNKELSTCFASKPDSIETHTYDVETQGRRNETQTLLYAITVYSCMTE